MAGLTLTQAQANLDAANSAYTRALQAKSYNVLGRGAQSHDIDKLRGEISHWQGEVRRLSNGGRGGMRIRGGTPT